LHIRIYELCKANFIDYPNLPSTIAKDYYSSP
jgi:hypothetical protein